MKNVSSKIQRTGLKKTYPKVSILCWFFHENHEFFGNFTKEPGTEDDVVLKILQRMELEDLNF
jgi:hypothetical protein